MISTMKTALISAVLLVGVAAALLPGQAQAAPRNGDGVVYHPSDCGRWNVRFYGYGGDGNGSACGYWLRGELLGALWNSGDRNHNYTQNEIYDLMRKVEIAECLAAARLAGLMYQSC